MGSVFRLRWAVTAVLLFCLERVVGDVYMHNPRGSNNKLSEQQNNVRNDNRLFDSQNNAAGGYQVGDACDGPCQKIATQEYDDTVPGARKGVMQFYEGSELQIEWTNQHGCGANSRLHCNVVLQYMCEDTAPGLRDGTTTDTHPYPPPTDPAVLATYGQHEPPSFYTACATRTRNKNLFTADRNLNNRETAIYTRQGDDGERYGMECPEERDYWPYWHPTPWRDVWTCTNQPRRCDWFQQESQNVVDKGECSDAQYNNQKDCETNLATWIMRGAHRQPPPECTVCPTTRNNHLGQASGSSESPNVVWTLPKDLHADGAKCVLRIRYNISTADYDGWGVDKLFNGANSKVKGNPTDDFVGLGRNVSGPLTLNINTAQFGRTFEDRSHVFQIRKTPAHVRNNLVHSERIINLNVRGRRGNIVQVYPAVEYDFVPNAPEVKVGDYLHVQWTGSDANQRGNAGNGRDGTDRHNLVLFSSPGVNYPLNMNPLNADPPQHFTNNRNIMALMAYLNQTNCTDTNDANDVQNCKRLNSASAYVNLGLVKVENTGTFYFASVRNNAFSNREQKATLFVSQDYNKQGTIAGLTVLSVAAAGGIAWGIIFLIGFGHAFPASIAGIIVAKLRIPDIRHKKAPVQLEDGREATPPPPSWLVAKFIKWWAWEGQRATILALYFIVNVAVWVYGYILAKQTNNPAPYYPFAKGFGKTLNINCSFILLPVLRNILCWLRSTPLADIIPLDDNIIMHKLVFCVIAITAILHAVFHYLDFYWNRDAQGVSVAYQAWGNLAGQTGHYIGIIMTIMAFTSLFNRKLVKIMGFRFDGYRVFLAVHKLWIPAFAFLWLHGPMFWAFSLWPLALISLEKLVQSRRAQIDVTIIDAQIVGRDILWIRMKLQGKRKFVYKAGEYLFLNCPEIAEMEWHPFTITSAPEEGYFGCHIRCRPEMDWCYALRTRLGLGKEKPGSGGAVAPGTSANMLSKDRPVTPATLVQKTSTIELGDVSPTATRSENALLGSSAANSLRLRVDGPYGSPSEEVFDHDTVLLLGAGIGITPFVSILKSISLRSAASQHRRQKVHFYWICRDEQEFQSFKDLIDAVIAAADLKDSLTINIYTTGVSRFHILSPVYLCSYACARNWI
ncbi:hypothetical protein DFS34DRAFT_323892 [Phlyctochytrium arcticum]|nr:hypothetical protein DFS34DRAFT_323892 [Phlyctochytrium arcticum]